MLIFIASGGPKAHGNSLESLSFFAALRMTSEGLRMTVKGSE
jgi:hypothetical protein